MANKIGDEFLNYLHSVNVTKDSLFVDASACSFNGQRLVEHVLGKVYFAYWGVCENPEFSYLVSANYTQYYFSNWFFAESLMTSTEPPIVTIEDAKPVY